MTISPPAINAALNGAAAVLLAAGYVCIRRRHARWHARLMIGAFAFSVLFLVSYVSYHAGVGHQRFAGTGWIRPVYFGILLTHTVLAAFVAPGAVYVLSLAFNRRYRRHRRWARVLVAPWLYVSATGVLIYFMVYHWFRAS
ncbi:MAG: DUF420 domain-containing protein [Candidatus Sumerlaeia bacterium]